MEGLIILLIYINKHAILLKNFLGGSFLIVR